jgi:hypothetical protein
MRLLPFRAICGLAAYVIAALAPALAQGDERAMPTAQEFLRRVLEVAQAGDLTNADLLGEKLGLKFAVESQQPYISGGQRVATEVRFRLLAYDRRLFDVVNWPVWYDIFQPLGMSFKRVNFNIGIAAPKLCVTADDFRSVFGAAIEQWHATDFGGVGYRYKIARRNEIAVTGFFGHAKCMQNLRLTQDEDRLKD